MTLRAFIIAAMLFLAPRRDHSELAGALADVIEKEGCVVKGPECERRSAALATFIAYRESGFRLDAVGDGGRSVCAYQVWGGPESLRTDAAACTLAGYRRLRDWLGVCRGSLAGFASGSCSSKAGKRIDADRKWGANELLRRFAK